MRVVSIAAVCFAVLVALALPLASQTKDVTLTGKVTCAKCDLKIEKECATVIVVKENGKDVVYYLDAKADKANHPAICESPKDGTITGTVSEKNGKKYITATKVDLKK